MPDIFTPQSKTIEEIFDGNVYYEIPAYQRPYSWESEQIEDLWEDVYSAFKSNDEEYFLGSIILTKKDGSKNLDVVDGQQRLTTLMILFCALRDLYFSKLEDTTKKNRIMGRIKNSESGNERLKLRTQTQNQNQFEQEIINGINYSLNLTAKQLEENKFLNAAFKFKDKILSLKDNPSEIEALTDYLLERVRVISITCSNRSFAMKLFQVLNNRGLNLTAADLIKSFLMSKIGDEDQKTFEQNWIYVENKAKEFGEELTSLFTYYEYYLIARNPEKSLYDILETEFRNKDPLKTIHDFKLAVDLFFNMDNRAPKHIYPLYYLRHDVYWKSIILTSLLNNWSNDKVSNLAKILKKFYYIYWIAGLTTSATKQTSFNIIRWIKEGKDENYIRDELNKKIKHDKVIGRFKERLDEDVYQYPWSKPLLILLEYEQLETPHMNFIEEDKNIHLEHILPQSHSSNKDWSKINVDIAEKLVNTIGNLTLLSGKRNIEASNNSFAEKTEIYKGKGKDGITPFELTKKVAQLSEWNEISIRERKEFILSEIERVFEIDFDKNIEEERIAVDENNKPKKEKSDYFATDDAKEKLRLKFWEQLLDKEKLKTNLHSNVSPGKYHWIGTGAGKSGISYNFVILNSYVGCEVYLDRGKRFAEPNINKKRFDELSTHRDEIEKLFGDKLNWERLDDKRACRISFVLDYGINDQKKWPEMQDQMIDVMIRLEKSTKPFIKELN